MRALKKLVVFLWVAWLGYMTVSLASIAWSPPLGGAGLSPEMCARVARLSAAHFSTTCWICLSILLPTTLLSTVAAQATRRRSSERTKEEIPVA